MNEPIISVSVFKCLDKDHNPRVALVLSQNAMIETSDTNEPYPGTLLPVEAARQVVEKLLAVIREIEGT